ncbi:YitT family protein [Gynuella sp.]|uniref:YitT family protein n=1 Tax=Gynuella sp. TaxID=2969146 RepID=UPI003D0A958A
MRIFHRWLSIVEGCFLVALGIHLLSVGGLLISGTAGLSLILIQITPFSFGLLFFTINLPFYIFSYLQMGLGFTLRTFISVSLLTLLSELMRRFVHIEIDQVAIVAILGGLLIGFGLILLFRHQSSLGGFNVMVLYIEKCFGVHAGKTTLALDILVMILALVLIDVDKVAWSLLAFFTMASVVGRYHRPPTWAKPYPAQISDQLEQAEVMVTKAKSHQTG